MIQSFLTQSTENASTKMAEAFKVAVQPILDRFAFVSELINAVQ